MGANFTDPRLSNHSTKSHAVCCSAKLWYSTTIDYVTAQSEDVAWKHHKAPNLGLAHIWESTCKGGHAAANMQPTTQELAGGVIMVYDSWHECNHSPGVVGKRAHACYKFNCMDCYSSMRQGTQHVLCSE